MKKIIYVPLDERPCNYQFPGELARGTDFLVVKPDLGLMGRKKKPGNIKMLWEWLFKEVKEADGAILSIDTLVYGGLIPSRLHTFTKEECELRLNQMKRLKEINPALTLYVFNLIMRCPQYSSSDEEPDYYENFGAEIFRQGYIKHRIQLGNATEEEVKKLEQIRNLIPEEYLTDYLTRRAINLEVNKASIQYVKDKTIDFMVIPQDDSAPYGLTAIDQQKIRKCISVNEVELKVFMYPGADEVGCTLLSRMINFFTGTRPLIYPRFSSIRGPLLIPKFEDRPLYESLKYQIIAAGGLLATSASDADVVLMVNSPGNTMVEAEDQNSFLGDYSDLRNLVELAEYAEYTICQLRKTCIIADIAFANGSDLTLLRILKKKGLLFKLSGYAGWNTSSNTLGTCIAQGIIHLLYGNRKEHRDFLALRYVEDGGYCGYVRKLVTEKFLPEMGHNYFKVDGQNGKVAKIVKEELEGFIRKNINDETNTVYIDSCYMPWSRMFEVGLKVHVQP